MAASLQEKTAVVTGGSQGIGRQISLNLAKQGASVVVNYSSNKQKADEVVSQIESEHGKAIAVQGDVSSASAIKALFEKAEETFGKVHIVVNAQEWYSTAIRLLRRHLGRIGIESMLSIRRGLSWPARKRRFAFHREKVVALSTQPPRLSLSCSPTSPSTLPAKPRWRRSSRSWQGSSEGPKSRPIV